jgi:hypothetical protein
VEWNSGLREEKRRWQEYIIFLSYVLEGNHLSLFCPEDTSSTFLRKVDKQVPENAGLHPRKQ